jgi:hypothetical protein
VITEEFKESLKALTSSELLETLQFLEERRAQLKINASETNRQTKVFNAKQEIFTDYGSLLNDLAQ